jgi:hypothetical protein
VDSLIWTLPFLEERQLEKLSFIQIQILGRAATYIPLIIFVIPVGVCLHPSEETDFFERLHGFQIEQENQCRCLLTI